MLDAALRKRHDCKIMEYIEIVCVNIINNYYN